MPLLTLHRNKINPKKNKRGMGLRKHPFERASVFEQIRMQRCYVHHDQQKIRLCEHEKKTVHIRKPRHWGCRVYGLLHLEMFRNLEQIEDVKYTNTDSFLI